MAKKSILAIASLVLAIVGILIHLFLASVKGGYLIGFLFNLAAIALAIIALIKINKNADASGKGLAIAGLVLGILPFVAVLLMVVLFSLVLGNIQGSAGLFT